MFVFLDTETTGNGPKDRLCQIAFKTDDGLTVSELYNPGMPISIDAMSIHHITNEMVQKKPAFRESKEWSVLKGLTGANQNVVVAHNAKFDIEMLKREGIEPQKVVCTLKLARYLDKESVIPKYNLQYLRYFLNLQIEAKAHDALGDVIVLEALFRRVYTKAKDEFGENAIEQIIDLSKKPLLYRKMPFGKHKGADMDTVPIDYLQWLSRTDLNEDMEYTVRYYLNNILNEKWKKPQPEP
jgi:exodeoxyribonuclease X